MARTSRKAAIREMEPPVALAERIYNTAAYARLSVEDNKQSGDKGSISMQKYMLEKYVEAQPDMRLVNVFCDNGETGTNFDRPGFEKMMDEVKSRNVDCIVVKDLSRFGRNYVETGYYLEKIFPYLGVRFVAINDHYDTLDRRDGNELVLSLKNLVNDLYAKDISQKITSAITVKQKNGEFIGAFPPYGYLKSPEDKHKLIIDPETAPVVRDIFQWKLEGQGIAQIARRLNGREIPCPAMHHYMKGHKKKKPSGAGAIWQAQGVKSIAKNPVYAGHMAQGKARESLSMGMPRTVMACEDWIVVENTHEAIVSQETFDKVQEITRQRHEESCALRGKYGRTENIFKGLLVCADCGTKMHRYKDVYRSGKTRYTFICPVYAENLGGQGCTLKSVGEPELMESVFQTLRVQIVQAVELEKMLKNLQKQPEFEKHRRGLSEKIGRLEQEIKKNATLRGSLFESWCDHTLTEEEYLSMKAKYDRKGQEFKDRLAELKNEEQATARTLSPQNEWIAALKKYRKEKAVTRKMALELIKCIKVSGYNEIEIVWNFQDEFARIKGKAEGVCKTGKAGSNGKGAERWE